jgi:hypothetical protein
MNRKKRKRHQVLPKFYRSSTEKDKELYDALYEVIGEYLSVERLKEVAHCFDTNANESINNLIARLVPKNKFLSGSVSLKTQVAAAIAIQLKGFASFFRTLLEAMEINVTEGTEYWLEQTDSTRERKKEKQLTIEAKKKRKKVYYENLRLKTEKAQQDIQNGVGYYCTAVKKADEEEDTDTRPKKVRRVDNVTRKPCRCGSLTHQRTTSLQCRLNKIYLDAPEEIMTKLKANYDEQHVMNTISESQE